MSHHTIKGLGILLVITGIIMIFSGRLPPIGHLPGDIYIRRGNFLFFFPISSGLVIGLLVSAVIWIIIRR